MLSSRPRNRPRRQHLKPINADGADGADAANVKSDALIQKEVMLFTNDEVVTVDYLGRLTDEKAEAQRDHLLWPYILRDPAGISVGRGPDFTQSEVYGVFPESTSARGRVASAKLSNTSKS
jgi:hypothetical protein